MHAELGEEYVYSDPNRYFASLDTEGLPVVRDDLQMHAPGCYSAVSEIKRNNRYAENALLEAERLSVLSKELMHTAYPEQDLAYAWKRVLFNQFHDVLGGCSLREAYDDAREWHGEALSIAHRIQNFACQQISWNIDTLAGHPAGYVPFEVAEKIGFPVVVFNPLSHEIVAPVHIRNGNDFRKDTNVFRDKDGNLIPVQKVRDSKTDLEDDHYARLIEARVPALGYTVYRFYPHETEQEMESPFITTENSIENGKLRVTFDKTDGEIASIIDLESGKELLASPTKILICDDTKHDTWAHAAKFFKEDIIDMPITGTARVTETGPVRATVRVEQCFGNSRLIRDFSLMRSAKHIEVKVMLDFHEKHRTLKFSFPVAAKNARSVCKIPFGTISRANDGVEQVSGDWIALGADGEGITVATDSKHSFDADGNLLSLTVLRSAIFADHFGRRDEFCQFTEQGEQFFYYRIAPFTSLADAERTAEELQYRPFAIKETFHKGSLPTSFEGMSVSAKNVSVTAVKQQRAGEGTVIRVYENAGKDTDVSITLFGVSFDTHLSHDAVKTFLIKDGIATEIDFLE